MQEYDHYQAEIDGVLPTDRLFNLFRVRGWSSGLQGVLDFEACFGAEGSVPTSPTQASGSGSQKCSDIENTF